MNLDPSPHHTKINLRCKSQNYKVPRREYRRNFSWPWGKDFLEKTLQEITKKFKAMMQKIPSKLKISAHQMPPSRIWIDKVQTGRKYSQKIYVA